MKNNFSFVTNREKENSPKQIGKRISYITLQSFTASHRHSLIDDGQYWIRILLRYHMNCRLDRPFLGTTAYRRRAHLCITNPLELFITASRNSWMPAGRSCPAVGLVPVSVIELVGRIIQSLANGR
jgi:hypothetical protein